MKAFSRLDRYVASLFVKSYGMCLFFFVGLYLVAQNLSNLRHYVDAARVFDLSAWELFDSILHYSAVDVPFVFLLSSPFITLMAAIFTLLHLRASNEITPILTSGVSLYRALLPILLGGALLTAGMIGMQEWFVPRLSLERTRLRSFLEERENPNESDQVPIVQDRKGNHAFVERWIYDAEKAEGFHITKIEPDTKTIREVNAVWAIWDDESHRWILGGGEERVRHEDGRTTSRSVDSVEGTGITPSLLLSKMKDPIDLSFTELAMLFRMDPANPTWRILLHFHVTFPLANLLLLLLGLPLALRPEARGTLVGIAECAGVCVSYFLLDYIMRELGTRGVLHPVMAVWTPVILYGSLGITLFDSMRT